MFAPKKTYCDPPKRYEYILDKCMFFDNYDNCARLRYAYHFSNVSVACFDMMPLVLGSGLLNFNQLPFNDSIQILWHDNLTAFCNRPERNPVSLTGVE